jgi:membrane-associated HD superfamily phosphohydrolase
MLTKEKLPPLVAVIFIVELLIYCWSVWTSTFDRSNFFGIEPAFIFDKCARIAGRISSVIFLVNLLMVGYYGLKKIYGDERLKDAFLILITLFSINHLIHLLFVLLRFNSHNESILFGGPISIGGAVHGVLTFALIIIVPILLWRFKQLNNFLYTVVILHLLNSSSFIIKTFLGKIKPPVDPAYHNQLGVVVLTAACLFILFRVYVENRRNTNTV